MPTPRDTAAAAELDAAVIRLKNEGKTFGEIAVELGYSAQSRPYIYRCFERGKRRIVQAPWDEYQANQLAEIEAERALLEDIIHAEHPLVSHGHVVSMITGHTEDGTPIYGEPLTDAGPVLAALDRRAKLRAQEQDLIPGLKVAAKVDAVVETVSPVDIELRELIEAQQARNAATLAELGKSP
jgi:hypothetical protein